MNKLVVVLGAVAALSLVGGVSVKANALTFKELIGKVKEGANKLIRGDGSLKKHLDHVKQGWAEWKEKAKALKGKAKKWWSNQQKRIMAQIKKISGKAKSVSVTWLQKLKDLRDAAKAGLEKQLAKAGGKVKEATTGETKKAE